MAKNLDFTKWYSDFRERTNNLPVLKNPKKFAEDVKNSHKDIRKLFDGENLFLEIKTNNKEADLDMNLAYNYYTRLMQYIPNYFYNYKLNYPVLRSSLLLKNNSDRKNDIKLSKHILTYAKSLKLPKESYQSLVKIVNDLSKDWEKTKTSEQTTYVALLTGAKDFVSISNLPNTGEDGSCWRNSMNRMTFGSLENTFVILMSDVEMNKDNYQEAAKSRILGWYNFKDNVLNFTNRYYLGRYGNNTQNKLYMPIGLYLDVMKRIAESIFKIEDPTVTQGIFSMVGAGFYTNGDPYSIHTNKTKISNQCLKIDKQYQ